ncbi:ankyrin repeat-containing domain protein [Pisolithus albus]|nr:ankyrin repeat-containing domain protein [Pisolithus albus]
MTTGIHTAAQNNQLSVVRTLVTENTKVIDEVDVDGRTALHWAASTGGFQWMDGIAYRWCVSIAAIHNVITSELVGAGADVNKRNDKGLSPLHYAASKSRIDIGKFLIQRGADINARDKANQLPLHRAATTGSTGFITLLLNPPQGSTVSKPRLNTGDRVGNTPLHLAMDSAHAQAAVLLIEAGADRSRTNLEDLTPENVDGVGGEEQRRAREYVIDHCGPP